MKYEKNLPYLIIIFISIFLLLTISYWRYLKLEEFSKNFFSPKEIFQKELEGIKENFPLQEGNNQEVKFKSPDGKLELIYSSSWKELPGNTLKGFSPYFKRDGVSLLLFAQKMNFTEGTIAFLLVQEIEKKPKETIKDLINEIEKEAEKKKEISLKEKEAEVEFLFSKEKGIPCFAREKILDEGKKFFLVAIFSAVKDWPTYEKEAQKILDSVRLIE